jgi:hypothetical protein
MPPPIQSTITVSAVGVILGSGSAARTARGAPAASAESVAALAVFKKSRRDTSLRMVRLSHRIGL